MVFLISVFILILIKFNTLVFRGAQTGLMLWFNNVIPLLLPFMLLSGLLVSDISKKNPSTKKAILITLLCGLLCGYPIGACTIKNSINKKLYSKRTAEILLPLCNNSSPIFISGYIIQNSLKGCLSLARVLFILYIPYIAYVFFSLLFSKKSESSSYDSFQKENPGCFNIGELIYNISSIGVYIILCSAAAELLLAAASALFTNGYISGVQNAFVNILASSIEITRGARLLTELTLYSPKKITALILALTSFGGISSILQTKQALQNSGLSVKKYILVKLACAFFSFFLTLLLPL